jgi:DNA-binding IclR family transcriptional regulator
MTPSRALTLIGQARVRGYVVRERGLIAGTRGVSVTIASSARTPLAALTVGAADRRLAGARVGEVAAFLKDTAAAIEKKLSTV